MNVIGVVSSLTFPLHSHSDKPGLTGQAAKLPRRLGLLCVMSRAKCCQPLPGSNVSLLGN